MRLHLFHFSIDWGSQEMTTFPMVKPPSSLLCLPSLPPSCLWFVTPHPFSHIPNSSHISCFPSSLNTYLSIFTLYQFLPTLFPLFIEILNYLYLVWRIQRGNFGRRGILLTFLHVSIWTQIPCEVKWRTTSFFPYGTIVAGTDAPILSPSGILHGCLFAKGNLWTHRELVLQLLMLFLRGENDQANRFKAFWEKIKECKCCRDPQSPNEVSDSLSFKILVLFLYQRIWATSWTNTSDTVNQPK